MVRPCASLVDQIRPRAERRVERGFLERPRRVIGLGEDRQGGDGERQVAHEIAGKCVAHRVRVERLRLDHVLQCLMVDRVAFILQRVEGEHHVVGGERRAVGELRLGPQIEGDRLAVVGDLGALGHQPVDRVRLVGRRHHQRVEQQLEPLRRVAFQNVVVEAVEGGDAAPADQRESAAFGRVGIGVGEMLEIGRVGEIAEGREAGLLFRGGRWGEEDGENEGCSAGDRLPWPQAVRHQSFDGPGNWLASVWSNHQTCKKPGVRPGSCLGWPYRFQ